MEKDCAEEKPGDDQGSIMIVLATDAPLDSRQLKRLCRRAVVGLARTGSHIDHGSGDFVIAFSTAHFTERETQIGEKKSKEFPEDSVILWDVFRAVAECVEESILNSMSGADTVVGRDNHTVHGLPLEPVRRFISRYNSI